MHEGVALAFSFTTAEQNVYREDATSRAADTLQRLCRFGEAWAALRAEYLLTHCSDQNVYHEDATSSLRLCE